MPQPSHHQLWPALRAAVADTAHQHWHALRRIAPATEPRMIAAESVASTATALVQDPALWRAIHLADAILTNPRQARRTIASSGLTTEELAGLTHRLDALDHTARAWCARAYQGSRNDGDANSQHAEA